MSRILSSWVAFCLLACFTTMHAWADGKVFARAVATSVTTPDQRALLYYSNNVEKLVIDTSFQAEGTNFAWVVPFPSPPKVEAVSTNFFNLLTQTFQPKIVYKASHWSLGYLFCGTAILAGIYFRRKWQMGVIGFLFFLLFFFATMIVTIPNHVKARGKDSVSPAAVKVLNQARVGIYDTVTLASGDGRALTDWLNKNGYHTPTDAVPIISSYASNGWVFVAATLNRGNSVPQQTRPHPLAFTFSTTNAVYPLRLTGVENPKCEIELYVFGPNQASAPGFKADHCGVPSVPPTTNDIDYSSYEYFAVSNPGEYRMIGQELRSYTLPSAVVTRLTGKLTARDMEQDAVIRWIPFQAIVPSFYSEEVARAEAFDWTVGLAMLGLIIAYVRYPRVSERVTLYTVVGALALAACAGAIRRATMPTTEIKWVRGHWFASVNNYRVLEGALQQFVLEHRWELPENFGSLISGLSPYVGGGTVRNCFTEEPIKNEPTPGNLTLGFGEGTVDVFWYDINGDPHKICTFKRKETESNR